MIGAGLGKNDPNICGSSKIEVLFEDFRTLYLRLRALNPSEEVVTVEVGNKDLKFSHQNFGKGLDAYSRTTRGEDGKWLTVQLRMTRNILAPTVIDIFNEKGKGIASIKETICYLGGDLKISHQEMLDGKAAIIQSALLAVTGKIYEVAVAE